MGKLNIVSVDVDIPGLGEHFKSIDSMDSLSSYDIIVFRPTVPYIDYDDYVHFSNGGKAVKTDAYAKLKKQADHWLVELREAIKNGKTVIVLATPNKEISHVTGVISPRKGYNNYSTGDNNIYNCLLPYYPKIREARGREFSACKNDIQPIITQLHNSAKAYTAHEVIFTELESSCMPLLTTKSNQIVGFMKNFETAGKLVFWPNIDFEYEGSTHKKDGKEYWTDKASAIGKAFLAAIVALHKSSQTIQEPAPEWALENAYMTKAEKEVVAKIKDNEDKRKKLDSELQKLQENLQQEQILKSLLYTQGKELEVAVNYALGILGLKVKNYRFKTKDLEIDNLIDYNSGKIIGETEGKDTSAIAVGKIRQLVSNKDEYYMEEVENLSSEPKGILFGNPERQKPLAERTLDFTDACKQIATSKKIALVKTQDLFDITFYLKNNPDRKDFVAKCIEAMINTEAGIVQFPKPEVRKQSMRENSD